MEIEGDGGVAPLACVAPTRLGAVPRTLEKSVIRARGLCVGGQNPLDTTRTNVNCIGVCGGEDLRATCHAVLQR